MTRYNIYIWIQSLENHSFIHLSNGYGFLSFAKIMSKNLSNKYGQKLLDRAKKSTTDAIKQQKQLVI